jgi:hypothetical protein
MPRDDGCPLVNRPDPKEIERAVQLVGFLICICLALEVVSVTLQYVWRKDMRDRIIRLEKLHGPSEDSSAPR